MADMIGNALAFLNKRLKASASVAVTYRRSISYVTLSVVVESANINPLTVLAGAVADRDMTQPSPEHVDHPFSFNAEDLVIDDDLTTPQEGDVIEVTTPAGELRTYRLSPSFDGERSWKYQSNYETGPEARIRVNTRLMDVEP